MGIILLGAAPVYDVPSQASAWGFNNRTFFDDFDSLATIDVNNTGTPGYKWYTQDHFALTGTPGVQSQNPQPAATMSVAGSILTISNVGQSANNIGIHTTYLTGPNSGTLTHADGFLWQNGGYVEFVAAFDESLAPDTTIGGLANRRWPALWASSYPGTGYGARWMEIDVLDALPATPGSVAIGQYLYDHSNGHGGGDSASQFSSVDNRPGGFPASGALRTNSFHKYGLLWVPAAQNSGIGLYKWYVDDTLTNTLQYAADSSQAAYTTNPFAGVFMDADSHGDGYCVMISSGNQGTTPGGADWPLLIDKVSVFQL